MSPTKTQIKNFPTFFNWN